MPNHVTTISTVTGPAEKLKTFRAWLKDGGFDFNRIIPRPACIDETESSTEATLGYYALYGRFPQGERKGLYGARTLRDFGMVPREIETQEQLREWLTRAKEWSRALEKGAKTYAAECETGFSSWYEWCNARWGTKWNAYSIEYRELTDERVVFKFETAWSFPEPIFFRLHQMFPDVVFSVETYDEGGNFACVGSWGGANDFRYVDATDELYERVYGEKPERTGDDTDEDAEDDTDEEGEEE